MGMNTNTLTQTVDLAVATANSVSTSAKAMNSTSQPSNPSNTSAIGRGQLWTGRVLSGLAVLFLTMDGVMKLIKPAPVVEGTLQLGFPESSITGIGIVLLASVLLYVLPRTAMFGAIILTGYLGGAVATHVRVDNPLFSHTLFPVYFGILIWGGLWLRDLRVRAALRLK